MFILASDVKTESSTKSKELSHTGIIAGIAAALVFLLALILVAICIHCYPTGLSPLYLIQVHHTYNSNKF